METSILEVREDGTEVELMDGTVWTIHAGDVPKTVLWRPIQRIIVETGDDDLYPFTLTNRDTPSPEKVKASRFL